MYYNYLWLKINTSPQSVSPLFDVNPSQAFRLELSRSTGSVRRQCQAVEVDSAQCS
eukprot:m.443958 g.443958  ORF g.443958 m.443958 type:complete len:56 (+) comp19031_c0_seq1:1001-1168(+)